MGRWREVLLTVVLVLILGGLAPAELEAGGRLAVNGVGLGMTRAQVDARFHSSGRQLPEGWTAYGADPGMLGYTTWTRVRYSSADRVEVVAGYTLTADAQVVTSECWVFQGATHCEERLGQLDSHLGPPVRTEPAGDYTWQIYPEQTLMVRVHPAYPWLCILGSCRPSLVQSLNP